MHGYVLLMNDGVFFNMGVVWIFVSEVDTPGEYGVWHSILSNESGMRSWEVVHLRVCTFIITLSDLRALCGSFVVYDFRVEFFLEFENLSVEY